jgi:DNA topoisomerase-3
LPDYRYSETRVCVEIVGGQFSTVSRQVVELGWKQLFSSTRTEKDDEPQLLPLLEVGEKLFCPRGELVEKNTQPPKHFTDATLLAAMTGIARYVEDPEVKKVLKETDGLGTEATRAGIIELLFKRGFLQRKGQAIHSTETGQALINSLPDSSSKPDMTAQWEVSLDAISQKQLAYKQFIDELSQRLKELVDYAITMNTDALKSLPDAPKKTVRRGAGKRKRAPVKAKKNGKS